MNEFWRRNLKDLLHFLMINTLMLGFVGNAINIKVFSTKTIKRHPISTYFKVISVFDTVMLVLGLFYFIKMKYDYDLTLSSDLLCKFQLYLIYTNGAVSSWLIVVVSLDRFICIRFPRKFSFFYKFKFQIAVTSIIVAYNYVFYSFTTWNSFLIIVNNTETGKSEVACKRIGNLALQWMDLFNSTAIPFAGMLILSVLLIYNVRLSRIRVHGTNAVSSVSTSRLKSLKSDNRLAISVISLNSLFFILNLPIVVYDIFTADVTPDDLTDYAVNILYYAYYSIGFYTQMVVNREFRLEFLRLLNLRVIEIPMTEVAVANQNSNFNQLEKTFY